MNNMKCPQCSGDHSLSQCPNWRLLPVALHQAIRDAIRDSGCPMPETLWAAIVARWDLVSSSHIADLGPVDGSGKSDMTGTFQSAHDHAQPEQAPIQSVPDEAAFRDAIASGLVGLLGCGRVWSAWSYGTMGEGDFYPADESDECVGQVMDAIRPLLAAATTPPADKLTECRHCGFYVALNRAPADAPAAPTHFERSDEKLTDAILDICDDVIRDLECDAAEQSGAHQVRSAIAAHLARKG